MSGDSDRIAVPTNGRGPHPVAPLAGGADEPTRPPIAADARPADGPAARRVSPEQTGRRFGIVASLVLLAVGLVAACAGRATDADAGRAARHQPARPRRGVRDPGRGRRPGRSPAART